MQRIPVSTDDAFHLLVCALLLLDVAHNGIFRIERVQRKFERGIRPLCGGNREIRVVYQDFRVHPRLGQVDFVVIHELGHIDRARKEGCGGDKALLQHRYPILFFNRHTV